jgi:Flp pilus assembly protein TadG
MNRLQLRAKRIERGSVAVEFAVVMPTILIPLLAGALFFGRTFWHYTVAEKAAQDAARFIAAASPTELKTQCSLGVYKDACIVMAAMDLTLKEMAELNPGSVNSPDVAVYCDEKKCLTTKDTGVPTTVSVQINMAVEDPVFSVITSAFDDTNTPISIPITATARSYYVGN